MKYTRRLFFICLCLVCTLCWISAFASSTFPVGTKYDICFTPQGNCTGMIVNAINKCRHTVLVQAYSFTSKPIAEALVAAKKRGVDVRVILDKSQFGKNRYTKVGLLIANKVPVWEDYKPAIAHSKVIILDRHAVARLIIPRVPKQEIPRMFSLFTILR